MQSLNWLERLEFVGAAVAFGSVGALMVFYEMVRARAKRPIMKGGDGAQAYMSAYGALFVLGLTFLIAALVR